MKNKNKILSMEEMKKKTRQEIGEEPAPAWIGVTLFAVLLLVLIGAIFI